MRISVYEMTYEQAEALAMVADLRDDEVHADLRSRLAMRIDLRLTNRSVKIGFLGTEAYPFTDDLAIHAAFRMLVTNVLDVTFAPNEFETEEDEAIYLRGLI